MGKSLKGLYPFASMLHVKKNFCFDNWRGSFNIGVTAKWLFSDTPSLKSPFFTASPHVPLSPMSPDKLQQTIFENSSTEETIGGSLKKKAKHNKTRHNVQISYHLYLLIFDFPCLFKKFFHIWYQAWSINGILSNANFLIFRHGVLNRVLIWVVLHESKMEF